MKIQVDNVVYVEIPYTLSGDYVGSGTVARSNFAVFREIAEENGATVGACYGAEGDGFARDSDGEVCNRYGFRASFDGFDEGYPDVLIWSGGYGARCILAREGLGWVEEIVGALEDYPILDDDHHSDLEEQERIAWWADFGCDDFRKEMCKADPDMGTFWESVDQWALLDMLSVAYTCQNPIQPDGNDMWFAEQPERLAVTLLAWVEEDPHNADAHGYGDARDALPENVD